MWETDQVTLTTGIKTFLAVHTHSMGAVPAEKWHYLNRDLATALSPVPDPSKVYCIQNIFPFHCSFHLYKIKSGACVFSAAIRQPRAPLFFQYLFFGIITFLPWTASALLEIIDFWNGRWPLQRQGFHLSGQMSSGCSNCLLDKQKAPIISQFARSW